MSSPAIPPPPFPLILPPFPPHIPPFLVLLIPPPPPHFPPSLSSFLLLLFLILFHLLIIFMEREAKASPLGKGLGAIEKSYLLLPLMQPLLSCMSILR